jgi:hypothetical protein
MWVMLIKKIPCIVSPPRLSIHWAEPWPMVKQHKEAVKKLDNTKKVFYSYGEYPCDEDVCAFNDHPLAPEICRTKGAMGIIFMGEHIRIFPEEFTEVSDENMEKYIDLRDGSHVLIEYKADTKEQAPSQWMNKEQKLLYEAALLDGCTTSQAMRVMVGESLDISTIPVMGWYRVRPEYGKVFCSDEELEIS